MQLFGSVSASCGVSGRLGLHVEVFLRACDNVGLGRLFLGCWSRLGDLAAIGDETIRLLFVVNGAVGRLLLLRGRGGDSKFRWDEETLANRGNRVRVDLGTDQDVLVARRHLVA